MALQQLYSMMGAAVLTCEENKIPWILVNLGTVKKHATGKGNAKKHEMVSAAKVRWEGINFNEDEADAAHCAAIGKDKALFD